MDEIEYIQNDDFIKQLKKRERILDGLNQSSIWVDSHDDCYLYIEARDKKLLEITAIKALDSLCRVSLKPNNYVPIKVSKKIIDEIFVENRPTTILQLPEIINESIRWSVFYKDYPWSSNGNLSEIEGFRIPDCYMHLKMGSGECTMHVGDCV